LIFQPVDLFSLAESPASSSLRRHGQREFIFGGNGAVCLAFALIWILIEFNQQTELTGSWSQTIEEVTTIESSLRDRSVGQC
jgi:hypothetical protein